MPSPNQELANRLSVLKASPGWNDLLRLSQELVDRTVQNVQSYNGWDPHQVILLVARMQAAKQHHDMLFGQITSLVDEGRHQQMIDIINAAENALNTRNEMQEADRLREVALNY